MAEFKIITVDDDRSQSTDLRSLSACACRRLVFVCPPGQFRGIFTSPPHSGDPRQGIWDPRQSFPRHRQSITNHRQGADAP